MRDWSKWVSNLTPYFRERGSRKEGNNLVGGNGVEPFTPYLSDKCSTAELTAHNNLNLKSALPGSHLDSRSHAANAFEPADNPPQNS